MSVALAERDEGALGTLIEKVYQATASILRKLQSEPGYADLRSREQARLFGRRAGNGVLATLLHLARLGKLDMDLAHRVLKTPVTLHPVMQKIEKIL